MKKIGVPLLLFVLLTFSCKKTNNVMLNSDNKLLDFKINNQLTGSSINYDSNIITVIVPFTLDKTQLSYNFSVSEKASSPSITYPNPTRQALQISPSQL